MMQGEEQNRSYSSIAGDDPEYDIHRPSDDDGRTGMHTRFYPEEGSDTEKYERLKEKHESREDKQAEIDAGRRRDGATWCNALDFTDYQRDRVLYLIDRVDYTELNGFDLTAIEGVLAIIFHVSHEDGRPVMELTKFSDGDIGAESTTDRFQTICEHVGTTPSRVMQAHYVLRHEIRSVS